MKRLGCFVALLLIVNAGCRRPRGEGEAPPRVQPGTPQVVVKQKDESFTLQLDAKEINIVKGAKAKLKVRAVRKGYQGPITLEALNLPDSVTASSGEIKQDDFSAEIELTCASDATPSRTPGVQIDATALAGGQKVTSPYFNVNILDVPFALRVEPGKVQVQPGSSASIKISADRKRYQGPISLDVRHLPTGIKANKIVIPQGQTQAQLELTATAAAVEGQKKNIQIVGSSQSTPVYEGLSPNVSLVVVGAPFLLTTDLPDVRIPYGVSTAKVKVTVQRRDYQGPIDVSLRGLPAQASAETVRLAEGQSSVDLELKLLDGVPAGKSKIQIVATPVEAPSRQAAAPEFLLHVQGAPFTVRLEPPILPIPQGTVTTPWKVNVTRNGYDGPIKIELKNLPKNFTAGSALISGTSGKLDVNVPEDAGGDRSGIQVVATALASENKEKIVSGNYGVRILEAFTLTAQPAAIQLIEGGKGAVKVSVQRRTYKGAIELVLKNLPDKLTAGKATIDEGKDSAEIEIAAAANAPGGSRSDVQVVGAGGSSRKVASNPFAVTLQSKLFELRVRPEFVALPQGEKAVLKVAAIRRNYQGPIALDLRGLPSQVGVSKQIIAGGQTEADLELAVSTDAAAGTKSDVSVVGTATAGGNQQVTSAPFRLDVKQGLFDLKVDPPIFKITHGASGKVKVIAVRKGYKGPINLELKNVPKEIKVQPGVIAPNKNDTEVELQAAAAAGEGDFVDLYVRGSNPSIERAVLSPRFTLSVASYGQEPALIVKAPATVKVAPGSTAKVKVTLVRKKFDGPVAVQLRNLPNGLESDLATIDKGETSGEVTITATARAETGTRPDVCAVATAALPSGATNFASPALTLHVSRK